MAEKPKGGMTRRTFMISMAALAAAGLGAYHLMQKEEAPVAPERPMGWGFLKDKDYPDSVVESKQVKRYVQMGPTTEFRQDTEGFEWAMGIVQERIQLLFNQGKILRVVQKPIKGTYRFLGIPESPNEADDHKRYVITAADFMYENINGLVKNDLTFHALRTDETFARNYDRKFFIGEAKCAAYDLSVPIITPNGKEEEAKITIAKLIPGGIFRAEWDPEIEGPDKLKSIYGFVGTGISAVNNPFSELLPRTTLNATGRYHKKVGIEEATAWDEAIGEAISYHLGVKIIKELNIPTPVSTLDKLLDQISGQHAYRYVNQSVQWITENGIQNAFDLYMEDPKKYMQEIYK